MVDIITLSCPACGGRLEIRPNVNRFACGYCGNESIVHKEGGIITLEAVEENIQKIQLSSERIATELAIPRLEKEIASSKKDLLTLIEYRNKLLENYQDIEKQYNKSKNLPISSIIAFLILSIMFGIIFSGFFFAGILKLDSLLIPGALFLGLIIAVPLFYLGSRYQIDTAENVYERKLAESKIPVDNANQQIEIREKRIKKLEGEIAKAKDYLSTGR